MPDLEIEEVATSAGLEALAPAWQELWERAPAGTPFHAPAWLIPWWREVGGGDLRVIAARRDGRLVGLLPMYLRHEAEGGKLLPLGIAISDYLDGLFDQDGGVDIAEAMLRRLADCDDWQRCELHPLRPGASLLHARMPGCGDQVLAFEPCLVLSVPAQARELCEVVPSRIRANLRYFRRRAEALGQVSFETATTASVSTFLDALFSLHETRWRHLDQPGVLADPAVRRFHRAAAPLLLRRAAAPARAAARRADRRGCVCAVRQRPRLLLPQRLRSGARQDQPRHADGRPRHSACHRRGRSRVRFPARPGALQVFLGCLRPAVLRPHA